MYKTVEITCFIVCHKSVLRDCIRVRWLGFSFSISLYYYRYIIYYDILYNIYIFLFRLMSECHAQFSLHF